MIGTWLKREPVLIAAGFLAVLSSFFSRPKLSYIDFRVLVLLFCLMTVVAAFQNIKVFQNLAHTLMGRTKSVRGLFLILVFLTFFSSMLITNDVALITFVPFSLAMLRLTGLDRYRIFLITMETIAANLGSSLTPVGNPQNLYLYSYYNLSLGVFFRTTLPFVILGGCLLMFLLFIHKNSVLILPKNTEKEEIPRKKLLLYGFFFLLSLLSVFRILNHWILLAVILCYTMIFDRKLLKQADYGLLLTFVAFFLFVGNLSAIPAVEEIVKSLIQGKEILFSALLSQGISNVPAAVMLSGFTQQGTSLLVGTNVGGLGTLVASLASLISFKFYLKEDGAKAGHYLLTFTLWNLLFLTILLCFSLFWY